MIILSRDYQDIIITILESAGRSQGVTKTKIMNVVKLSYNQLKTYLPYLQRKELSMAASAPTYDKNKKILLNHFLKSF